MVARDLKGIGERKVEVFGGAVSFEIAFLAAGSALENPTLGKSRLPIQ